MQIIGLSGKKQSGKDTFFRLAKNLLETQGLVVARYAFADPLKREVAEVLDIPIHEIEDNKPSYRMMLQWWGTEWRREIQNQPNYWINKMVDFVNMQKGVDVVIITDCRFENEAKCVRDLGGCIVRVVRPAVVHDDTHSSEDELPSQLVDLYCPNTGTMAEFETAVHRLISPRFEDIPSQEKDLTLSLEPS